MTRRNCLGVVAAALAADSLVMAKDNDAMKELLEASQNDKKGVMLYVKGQSIAGIVTKISSDMVEMRSREYSRIVVRIESIDAAALS